MKELVKRKNRLQKRAGSSSVAVSFYCSSDSTDCDFWLAWANIAVPA